MKVFFAKLPFVLYLLLRLASLLRIEAFVTPSLLQHSKNDLIHGNREVVKDGIHQTAKHRLHFQPQPQKSTPTSLHLSFNPIVVGSAVGHLIGGNLATPFVIDAVNTWYARIPLPEWTPPNGIFAPVWTFLYVAMGVAVARVAAVAKGGWKAPLVVAWGLHYLLNLTWAPLFFGMAKLRAGLVVNFLLVASAIPLAFLFFGLDKIAGALLIPYGVWLLFATVLNLEICRLNPMDGSGYSNAKLEADIAKLQKEAGKKVGL